MNTEQFIKEISALSTVEQKRAFYLNDMVAYYNGETRCTTEGRCQYTPTEFSEGCAIGRRLPLDLCTQLDLGTKGLYGVNNDIVFERLPKWMKELGQDFLTSCQQLHDGRDNWRNDGLHPIGELKLDNIKSRFC